MAFMKKDVWTRNDSELAEMLLGVVEQETERERRSTGTASDPDAWVWRDHAEAPLIDLLAVSYTHLTLPTKA